MTIAATKCIHRLRSGRWRALTSVDGQRAYSPEVATMADAVRLLPIPEARCLVPAGDPEKGPWPAAHLLPRYVDELETMQRELRRCTRGFDADRNQDRAHELRRDIRHCRMSVNGLVSSVEGLVL